MGGEWRPGLLLLRLLIRVFSRLNPGANEQACGGETFPPIREICVICGLNFLLALLGADDDLDAAIELLFFDRPIGRHDQFCLSVALGLDAIAFDAHVCDQPGLDRFGSALAQVHIILIAPEGVRVAFDPEDRLRVSLNQTP
jgi:hypothetical protein